MALFSKENLYFYVQRDPLFDYIANIAKYHSIDNLIDLLYDPKDRPTMEEVP